MQTRQRKIPYPGFENGMPANFHWIQVLEKYEKELDDFKRYLHDLETSRE
jgi:hypothetical protein